MKSPRWWLALFVAGLPFTLSAAEAARAIHERLVTLDTHLDTPANLRRPGWNILERHTVKEDLSQVDGPRLI